jgi:glycosyltransferase involved in cell wall biosynthesis
MQKRILIITDNLQDQINGVVTTFENISKISSRDGYDLVYITPWDFPHTGAPGYPEVKLSWPKGIGKLIEEANASHIHIATEGTVGLAGRIYCDKKGYKYNTSYHTRFPEFIKKIYHIPLAWTYIYLRWFHKHSGKVLTTTPAMVRDLIEHGFKGKIVPWTRGVDREVFHPDYRTKRKDSRPVLLSVGRVSKEKGLEDFCKLDYDATKIVVGDGPFRKELEKRYPDVKFVGVKRGRELAQYYANADVFVFPSINDTFGIVMIEAMACGTPVAAYPVTGPADVIMNGLTGVMDNSLVNAVDKALLLDRDVVHLNSLEWTWARAWDIFKDNLVKK